MSRDSFSFEMFSHAFVRRLISSSLLLSFKFTLLSSSEFVSFKDSLYESSVLTVSKSVSRELIWSLRFSTRSSFSSTCWRRHSHVFCSSSIWLWMLLSSSIFLLILKLLSWSWSSRFFFISEASSNSSSILINLSFVDEISCSFSFISWSADSSFDCRSEMVLLAISTCCLNSCFSLSATLESTCISAISFWVCNRSSLYSCISCSYWSCTSRTAVCFSLSSWYFNSMLAATTFCSAIITSLSASWRL